MRDGDVVRRVRSGDHEAYRELVDRHAPMVFALVRRYCADPAEAEDLAQEVFVRAYEGLDDFRGDSAFSSWLYRIAVNRCRDWAKSPRREERSLDALTEAGTPRVRSAESDGPGALGLSTPAEPDEALEREERARRLRRAIGELTPEYAVPFLLKYEEDLSYREIAERLDVTEGALKVRVHRARARLRELLGDM